MREFARRVWRLLARGPAMRISLGLSSLAVSLVLAGDLAFGLLPNPNEQLRQVRTHLAESLAIQVASAMATGNAESIKRLFREVRMREKSILSAAVRRSDGSIVTQAGNHAAQWVPPPDHASQLDNLKVPLMMNGLAWGDVEVSFERASPDSFWSWLRQPSVSLLVLLGLGSFVAFSLYLHRVLAYLDPSKVIPERVRSAFDVFSGGVMIVDPAGRVMLANTALRAWMQVDAGGDLLGRAVETIPLFKKALPPARGEHPWMRAMKSGTTTEGEPLEFALPNGEPLRVVANSSPIMDGVRKVRGCLVTLENVTYVHELNARLTQSMAELESSRHEVEKQNQELARLATRDSLTGCLNRRALFERLEPMFAEARDNCRALACIMVDIDHFKLFNDRHGHAIGDRVLERVALKLASAVREVDLLCRYGGEEFCMILPNVDLDQACAIAERLRAEIERNAGASIREISGLEVTVSFGVAAVGPEFANAELLIDGADQALYAAKAAGRNLVKAYAPFKSRTG